MLSAVGICAITAAYCVYVTATKGDGAIFAAYIAGLTAILTLSFKNIYDKYKSKRKVK